MTTSGWTFEFMTGANAAESWQRDYGDRAARAVLQLTKGCQDGLDMSATSPGPVASHNLVDPDARDERIVLSDLLGLINAFGVDD